LQVKTTKEAAMKVRDIMTTGELATATLDSTLEEISVIMRDENVGAIPILDEDNLPAGIITDRDIVVRAIADGLDPAVCTAEEILAEQLHIIEPDASLEQAADMMARHKIRRLPVVEAGAIVGMISLSDISVTAEEGQSGDALYEISEESEEDVTPARESQKASAPQLVREGAQRRERPQERNNRDTRAAKGPQKGGSRRSQAGSAQRGRSWKKAS
jgi:CBS domain-containing protein